MAARDEELVRRLITAREASGLSQSAVAERMRHRGYQDFRQQTIAKIETGERSVKWGEALALADSVGLTPRALMDAESNLLVSYARLDVLRDALWSAAWAYLEELITTAHTADTAASVRDVDDAWLSDELPWQTPLMLLHPDTRIAFEASLKRRGIEDPGKYLNNLIAGILRDAEALESARKNRAQRKGT